MRRGLFAALIAACGAVPAAAVQFSGHISAWRQDCGADGCSLPASAGSSSPVTFTIEVPLNSGEARTARFEREFLFGWGEKIRATVTVYFVCPPDAASTGGDSCPARYVQVQTELSGDARAFCGASLNPADARPFPVLTCAGPSLRRPGERLGVSLSRRPI